MKIKIGEAWGTSVERDLARVAPLRELAGAGRRADGRRQRRLPAGQARRVGAALDELGVAWFEEPVSSDDPTGLALLRGALRCDVAAGEYAADLLRRPALLPAVDCLQLDATRCGGYTGFLRGGRPRRRAQPAGLRRTARPPLHAPSPQPCRTCATSNSSPTTPGSNLSSSTGYRKLARVRCIPTLPRPVTA